MKTKILILSFGFTFITAKAQMIDTSPDLVSAVPVHLSSTSDTLYSEFDVFAGIQVTGVDEAHVWIDAPTKELKMEHTDAVIPTNVTTVILELSDSMVLNLDESIIADTAKIQGGLKLGLHTYIEHVADKPYKYFGPSQQYSYYENFDNRRSTIFAPSLLEAERDSLGFASGDAVADSIFSIHFWDNKTVSFVTGYHKDASTFTVPAEIGSTGSDEDPANKDWTVYDPGDKSYQHFENEPGLNLVSEKFLPKMVDNGRAVVIYYGDTAAAHTSASYSKQRIYSKNGFHDGTIELDITNQAPEGALFRHWHMIGNPYRSGLNLQSYLDTAIANTGVQEVNGYYGTRTLSLLMDVDNGTAGFDAGYVAVNSAGIAVGLNNYLIDEDALPDPSITTITELAAGQGFFVFHTAVPGQTVKTKFMNSMRTSTNTKQNLLKQSEFSEPLAFINVSQAGSVDKAIKQQRWSQFAVSMSDDIDPNNFNGVVMKQDLSTGADEMLSMRDINTYSQIKHEDDNGFAIQNVDMSYVNKLIPVGFESKIGNVDFEFALSKRSINLEEYDVFIVDRVLNTTHNISKSGPYKCNIFQPGKQQDRFFMKFGHAGEDGFVETVDLYSNGDFIYVHSNSLNTEIQEMSIYDVTGRLITNVKPNAFQSYQYDIRNFKRGVYFVTVQANGKIYKTKVLNNNN